MAVPGRPCPAARLQLIRRRRRRRLQGAAAAAAPLAVIAIAVTLVMVLPAHGKGHRPVVVPSTPPPAARPIPLGGAVSGLRQPGALAVGPDGQLYLADDGRNQVLQLVPGGKFRVVAGNGKRGFSGDGGRADAASLNDPGGLAATRSGALYIADTGYSEILKLAASGRLTLVAGTRRFAAVWEIGHRATEASPDGPDGLAFDRAGNLYIAGSNTKTLLEITSGGIMRLPDGNDGFYPRGPRGLAPAPNGSVLAMNGQQIDQVTSRGIRTLYTCQPTLASASTASRPAASRSPRTARSTSTPCLTQRSYPGSSRPTVRRQRRPRLQPGRITVIRRLKPQLNLV